MVLVKCCHVVSEADPGSGLEGAGGGRERLGDLRVDPRTGNRAQGAPGPAPTSPRLVSQILSPDKGPVSRNIKNSYQAKIRG